jgi:hypothetical protein
LSIYSAYIEHILETGGRFVNGLALVGEEGKKSGTQYEHRLNSREVKE